MNVNSFFRKSESEPNSFNIEESEKAYVYGKNCNYPRLSKHGDETKLQGFNLKEILNGS